MGPSPCPVGKRGPRSGHRVRRPHLDQRSAITLTTVTDDKWAAPRRSPLPARCPGRPTYGCDSSKHTCPELGAHQSARPSGWQPRPEHSRRRTLILAETEERGRTGVSMCRLQRGGRVFTAAPSALGPDSQRPLTPNEVRLFTPCKYAPNTAGRSPGSCRSLRVQFISY